LYMLGVKKRHSQKLSGAKIPKWKQEVSVFMEWKRKEKLEKGWRRQR